MTEPKSRPRYLGFFGWLSQTKVHEWIISGTAVVTVLISLGYLEGRVSQVEQDTGREIPQLGVERETAEIPSSDSSEQQDIPLGYVVQLASYFERNCDVAAREANSYQGQFVNEARLYSSPSGTYVVVGVPAADRATAEAIRAQARELSNTPQFRQEDLGNARIRKDPDWRPVTCDS